MRLRVVGCSGSLPGPTSAGVLLPAGGRAPRGRRRPHLAAAARPRQRRARPAAALRRADRRSTPSRSRTCTPTTASTSPACTWRCGTTPTARGRSGCRCTAPPAPPRGWRARTTSIPTPAWPPSYAVHEWAAGTPVTIGPFTVTPHPAEHPVEAYALRVEGPAEDDPSPSGRRSPTPATPTPATGLQAAAAGRRPAAGRGRLPGGPRHHPRHPPHRSPRGRGRPRRRRGPARAHPPAAVERPRGRARPGARGLGRPAVAGRAGPARSRSEPPSIAWRA